MQAHNPHSRRLLFIVADRQRTKFFTVFNHKLEQVGELLRDDSVPQKVRSEGFSPGRVNKHINDHLLHRLKDLGSRANLFLHKHNIHHIDGVIVGGHKELFRRVSDMLPLALREKVIGTFVTDLDPHPQQILQKASQQLAL